MQLDGYIRVLLCHLLAAFDLQALRHTIDNGKVFLAVWKLDWKFRRWAHGVTRSDQDNNK